MATPTTHDEALVDEIEQIRERLAGTVDALIDRTNPKSIARRSVEDVKARFVGPDGSLRYENVVPLVLGVVGTVAAVVVLRRVLG